MHQREEVNAFGFASKNFLHQKAILFAMTNDIYFAFAKGKASQDAIFTIFLRIFV